MMCQCAGVKRKLVRQLTAGAGLRASNERRLILRLCTQKEVPIFKVRWPYGQVQEFRDLSVDQEVLLRESHNANQVISRD